MRTAVIGSPSRHEYLTYLDLRNAKGRSAWARRYHSGEFYADLRTDAERQAFEAWYSDRLQAAIRFLQGGHDDRA